MAKPQASSSRFLDLLDDDDRAAIDSVTQVRRYARGAWIMRQGEPSDSVCIVLEGRAKVMLDTPDGRTVVLDIFGPGDVLGEFEALGDYPTHAASIIALDPIVGRVITRLAFREYLLAHPAASLALVRATIRRLGAADRRRIDRTAADASHALARFLVELIDRGDPAVRGDVEVDVPLAQHELASLIGVSRNSAVRALTSLRSLGLVATTRPTVRILDVAGLRRYAQTPRAPTEASSRRMTRE